MIDSLNIASDGYLNKGLRKVLVIAVAGLLMFPVPVEPSPVVSRRTGKLSKIETGKSEREKIIERDDDEILYIIKIFLECQ